MLHAKMPTPGAIALGAVLTLSTGCAERPTVSANPDPPEYDAETLDCVADALESEEWRGCIETVVLDWIVWVRM